jgi:FHS family L-fucose permease-like MFS transporter
LIQFWFFGAYGITSIPASKIIEKVGYHKGIIIGFIVAAIGCLLFYPAVVWEKYFLFLIALFVLASGIVMLIVAGNPYVSVLGSKGTASSRLSMVQGFNSFGTFIAPFFGAIFILSDMQKKSADLDVVMIPYFTIAAVLIAVAVVISKIDFPVMEPPHVNQATWKETFKNRNLIWGMIGIFAYVGAEVSIGSFLVNYVIDMEPMPAAQAANLVAIYWGGAMAGRFLGIFVLREFETRKVLMTHSLIAFSLILISINSSGMAAVYSMILVGFCNSIMFPSIFTLSIEGINGSTKKASGVLGTAIIGGALVPLLTGQMADTMGLRYAFIVPSFCYLYIVFFGMRIRSVNQLSVQRTPSETHQRA